MMRRSGRRESAEDKETKGGSRLAYERFMLSPICAQTCTICVTSPIETVHYAAKGPHKCTNLHLLPLLASLQPTHVQYNSQLSPTSYVLRLRAGPPTIPLTQSGTPLNLQVWLASESAHVM